jgi:hypothetical protein
MVGLVRRTPEDLDSRTHTIGLSANDSVLGTPDRVVEHRCGFIPAPDRNRRLAGGDQPLRPRLIVGCERGGLTQRTHDGRKRAACPGPVGNPIEFARDTLVRRDRRRREVPGPMVVQALGAAGLRERAMDGTPLRRCCAVVGRRTKQRMAPDQRSIHDLDEPGILGRRERVNLHPEALCGAVDDRH